MIFVNNTKCFEGNSSIEKPSTAKIGDIFFETDTNDESFWDGNTWVPKENLYLKYNTVGLNEIEMFTQAATIQNIYENEEAIVAVNVKSSTNFAVLNKSTGVVFRLAIGPRGANATDLPIDPETGDVDWDQFLVDPNPGTTPETPGINITARSITEVGDYYLVGLRYSKGIQRDGVHLCGGICFINKNTITVAKTYWLDYFVSRLVYDPETGLLAAGLQMGGLRFYTVNGTELTEVITFSYDQSTGSLTKGRESQHGCFYSQPDGKRIYANTGFGAGIRFYDVTDPTSITYISEINPNSYPGIYNIGSVHTYTSIVRFPYLYTTVARKEDDQNPVPIPKLDGVMTIDVSNLQNPEILHFEHINESDGLIKNTFGDTKPTEMEISQNVLYLNYEKGYLVFEIDARGGSTKYCGRFTESVGYGICGRSDGSVIFGISSGIIRTYDSKKRYTITNNLTRVTTSNSTSEVKYGSEYVATLTLTRAGDELTRISVIMDGVDITSTTFDAATNTISITSVTGDIVITAVASKIYWRPSTSVFSQYQASKPATISVDEDNVSIVAPQGNSGFKAISDLPEAITGNISLKIMADAASVTEPSSHTLMCQFVFKDSNGQTLKTKGFFDSSSSVYVNDVLNGITITFGYNDIVNSTQMQLVLRTANSSDTSLFPAEVSFTNLRVEVVD